MSPKSPGSSSPVSWYTGLQITVHFKLQQSLRNTKIKLIFYPMLHCISGLCTKMLWTVLVIYCCDEIAVQVFFLFLSSKFQIGFLSNSCNDVVYCTFENMMWWIIWLLRPKIYKIVAAFRGMHVSPAKHSSASVTDGRTDRQTDDG